MYVWNTLVFSVGVREIVSCGFLQEYRIAGFFRGGIFSRIHTATIFRGKIFTNDSVSNYCCRNFKIFTGKIFTNRARFAKFMKIFPLEKNPLYGKLIEYCMTYDRDKYAG